MSAKVGCMLADSSEPPTLQAIEPSMQITAIVKCFCDAFKKTHHERFQLRDDASKAVITSENQNELIKNGAVFILEMKPEAVADTMIESLASSMILDQEKALKELRKATEQLSVAERFVEAKAHLKLLDYVNSYHSDPSKQTHVAYALTTLNNCFNHKLLPVNLLDNNPAFLNCVFGLLRGEGIVVYHALLLASHYVRHSPKGLDLLYQSTSVEAIIKMVKEGDALSQEYALTLLNVILEKTEGVIPRQELYSKLDSSNIMNSLTTLSKSSERLRALSTTCKHQLYVFQRLWLRRYAERSKYSFNPSDTRCIENLQKLVHVLPDKSSHPTSDKEKYKMLGFSENPEQDFQSEPGVLTLDAMAEFVELDHNAFAKLVFEQDARPQGYSCPIIKMAQETLLIMLDLLGANKPIDEKAEKYYTILYARNQPFFRMFGFCLQRALKTWREMEARFEDFRKVVAMVRQQIKSTLDDPPQQDEKMEELDDFGRALMNRSYSEMLEAQRENENEALGRQMMTEPVTCLRKKLRENMQELVKEQRLVHMTSGCKFIPWSRGKPKKDLRVFAMLSPNYKLLKWSEPRSKDDLSNPNFSALPNSCDPRELKVLFVRDEIEEMATAKKKDESLPERTFAILGSGIEENLIFTASNRSDAAMWIDGIRSLMSQPMSENESRKEIESLLKLEVRLNLLNLHGIEIPNTVPEVPALPEDFNFVYQAGEEDSTA